MPRHHVIPKHEWLKRFESLQGVNAPDNLVNLTLPQHAEVHLLLYELNHDENDLIAHKACVGTLLKQKKRIHKNKKKKSKRKRRTRNRIRRGRTRHGTSTRKK